MSASLPDRWETERLAIYVTPQYECDRLQKIYETSFYLASWTGIDASDRAPDYVKRCRNGDLLPARVSRDKFRFMSISRKSNAEPIGLMHFLHGHPDESTLYVGFLFIQPDDQRCGYGREIVDELARLARSAAYTNIRLVVQLKNWPALRFWIGQRFTNIYRIFGDEKHSNDTFAEIEIARLL